MSIIRAIIDLILKDAEARLSEEKYQAMRTWAEEIQGWMDIFLFDRDLRWKRHKSIFYDNKNFGEFISAREAGKDSTHFVESLILLEDNDLKLASDSLFPELLNRPILGSQANVGMEKVINEVTQDSLSALRKLLLKSKAAQHLEGIALLSRLQRLLKASDFERNQLVELTHQGLDEMTFSPSLQSHVTALIEAFVDKDTSYKNSCVLAILNSDLGKKLQQKIWGATKTLTFYDLLQRHSKTKLLFEREGLHPSGVNFVNRVLNWSLNRALSGEINVPHSKQVSVHTGISVPSLFNVSQIYWSIVSPVEDYILLLESQDLNRPLDPKNRLNKLIKEGCFTSWLDILSCCLPLHQLNALDIEHLDFFFPYIYVYYDEIHRYLKKKTDFMKLQEELAQKAVKEHEAYLTMAERDDLEGYEYAELLSYFCRTYILHLPYLAYCSDVVTLDSPLDAIKALEIYEKAMKKYPVDKRAKLHINSAVRDVDNLKKFAKLQREKALVVHLN